MSELPSKYFVSIFKKEHKQMHLGFSLPNVTGECVDARPYKAAPALIILDLHTTFANYIRYLKLLVL